MNKKELIEKLKPLNKLRSSNSWNKSSKKELEILYNEALRLKMFDKPLFSFKI